MTELQRSASLSCSVEHQTSRPCRLVTDKKQQGYELGCGETRLESEDYRHPDASNPAKRLCGQDKIDKAFCVSQLNYQEAERDSTSCSSTTRKRNEVERVDRAF